MIDKGMIKKLSSAGVSPEIILNLMLDEDEPEQAAEVRAEPEAPAEPPQLAAPAPKPEPRKDDAILAAIEKLTGAIQASNIRSMSAGDPAQAETADTILASLIAPKAT